MRQLVIVFLSFAGLSEVSWAQASLNVSLFGTFNPVPVRYSGCWGWSSPAGNEYALLGGFLGTHVVAIDDSANIFEADFIDGQDSNWREITVIGDHAYVVTEGGGDLQGMQVIDLSLLPDSVHLVTTYTATFTRGHIISRDIYSDSAYVYISGTSTTGGVHFLDVSDPSSPVEVGRYDPTYYIHDAHVRGTRMYASALSQGFDIVDISDKSSPMLIAQVDYPNQFTHSSWTTEDERHLVVTDEVDGLLARIWNIEDVSNVYEVAQYSANLQSLVHNPYVLGDFLFVSHNTEGLRVVDIADPSAPFEVGFYDTYLGPSGGFNGLWSAYPYFPSGKIIGGNREDGLYVWKFNGTRAGRIYGIVSDSLNGNPLPNTTILIFETGRSTTSDSGGVFKLGDFPSGTKGYTITASLPNYHSKTIAGLVLNGGDSLWLDIRLASSISSAGSQHRNLASGFALDQNYPNPFNATTTIRFSLPFTRGGPASPPSVWRGWGQHTMLKIFDLVGQEVATLVNERKSPGTYKVTWDATGQPSGMYFYRLTAERFVQTRKLVLLR